MSFSFSPLIKGIRSSDVIKDYQVSIIYIWRLVLYVITITICFVTNLSTLHAHVYSVKGFFNYTVILPEGKPNTLKRQFSLSVEDNQWEMTIIALEKTNSRAYEHRYDGKQLFYFLSGPDTSDTMMSGFIENGNVPQNWAGAGGIYPWLAYISGSYFKNLTNEIAVSPRFGPVLSDTPERYYVPCHWKLSDTPPFNPIHIQYTNTGISILSSGKVIKRTLPTPYSNGYVSDEYWADQMTNYDNLMFPLQFKYQAYIMLHKSHGSQEKKSVLIVEGNATNIETHAVSKTYKIPNILVVQDARTPTPAVTYLVTNGILPKTNSITVSNATVVAQKKSRADSKVESNYIYIVRVIIIAFIIAPPLLYTISIIRRKKHKE